MQAYATVTSQIDLASSILQLQRKPLFLGEQFDGVMPLLEQYEPISLAQMEAVALMSRMDTKFVMDLAQLSRVLGSLVNDYWMLEVDGVRLNRYHTLYFDSDHLDLYASHHVGRSERIKVRSRQYVDSGLSFFEVKRHTPKGKTIKSRIQTDAFLTRLTPEADQFVDNVAPHDVPHLSPALWNDFSRITLVSKSRPERVTLDLDLHFWAVDHGFSLQDVVIAEVKQESLDRESGLMAEVRTLGIHPTNFSKYCVGTAMLHPEVKHNRFKSMLRLVTSQAR